MSNALQHLRRHGELKEDPALVATFAERQSLVQKPFYDDHAELEKAALARTVRQSSEPVQLPGLWNWIWGHDAR